MKRLVGNCPRCGNPIYEGKKAVPERTCMCRPMDDGPSVAPYVPVPVNPSPYYPWWGVYPPPNTTWWPKTIPWYGEITCGTTTGGSYTITGNTSTLRVT